ncbi:transcriptional regulator, BadM/Rrf2 family [Isosphaera pallida ATCC 43644]|jgi:Rrf2 family protein|uniref:Transcriptional regulator, BadM/Rrf2 family n=1 Tax=Isosphaera pallida (strain ATCC 43644 / DSM 9630 / IS1B) TaxID=575540 RepID=E8QZR9_ISOPI|nr:Rrf2 family transcriptional regulator [Isosphaera pallida]ADV63210.1 transcriptional regulator, BadM/Rrf2 family [Isosphaera pallida ATCC 43644]
MFTQRVEYALRATAYLASLDGYNSTTEEVAEATKVPRAYLSKVLQELRRGGVIRSRRGVGGGIVLAIDPKELTLLRVVQAVEPLQRITTCPLGLKAHGARLCPLHKRLDDAMAKVEAAFAGVTLAQVLAEPSLSVPLCGGIEDNPVARHNRVKLNFIENVASGS